MEGERKVRAEPLNFQLDLLFEQYDRHGNELRGGTMRSSKTTSPHRIPLLPTSGITPSKKSWGISHILLADEEPFQGKVRRTSLSCNLHAFTNNNMFLLERNIISEY